MRKTLKKYFIPHPENDHRPHLLRTRTVMWLLGVLVVFELLFISQFFVVLPSADFLASILPNAVVALTNAHRALAAEGVLADSPVLDRAAQMKADDMASKGYFAHTSPEGISPWYWFQLAGYRYTHAGENLAVNFYDSKDVVEAWMRSEGHRKNILNEKYTEIGVGVATGMYQEREAVFIVQHFGRPVVAASPAPVATGKETSPLPPTPPAPAPDIIVRASPVFSQEPSVESGTGGRVSGQKEVTPANRPASLQTFTEVLKHNALVQFLRNPLSAPRSLIAYGYVLLVFLFGAALFLKLSHHMRIRHPGLVVNGFFMIVVVTAFGYLNREIAFYIGKVF